MNIQGRIKALEKQFAPEPANRVPPVSFFDGIVDGTATPQEWSRWTPWLLANLPSLSEDDAKAPAHHDEKRSANWTPNLVPGESK